MKTEFEKMRSEELRHAKMLCARLQTMTPYDDDYRAVIEDLIPGIPASANICPPFSCDHGNGIRLAEGVFMNYGCVILDGAYVTVGRHTLIGPHCQLYTPQHPKDHVLRRETKETSHPITIGDRVIVAAGSVVVHDVPDDVLVAGNPAVIKRHLKQ